MPSNLTTCHRCPHRQRPCAGRCECTADEARRDIIEIASVGDCPKQFFALGLPAAPTPVIPLAGDLVAIITAKTGIERLTKWISKMAGKPCKCPERKNRLNRIDAKLRARFTR